MFANKEIRDIFFMAVAIFISMIICVTSMVSGNVFAIIASILMLVLLCVGFGYQFCKYESNIAEFFANLKEQKAQKKKAEKPEEFKIDEKIIENIIDNADEV